MKATVPWKTDWWKQTWWWHKWCREWCQMKKMATKLDDPVWMCEIKFFKRERRRKRLNGKSHGKNVMGLKREGEAVESRWKDTLTGLSTPFSYLAQMAPWLLAMTANLQPTWPAIWSSTYACQDMMMMKAVCRGWCSRFRETDRWSGEKTMNPKKIQKWKRVGTKKKNN